jgi:hypothetical protein
MKFFEEMPGMKKKVDWEEAKQELMDNEGSWGLIAEDVAGSTPQQLNRGVNKSFRGEELKHFEFRTSRPKSPAEPYAGRRTDLYGRYTSKPRG